MIKGRHFRGRLHFGTALVVAISFVMVLLLTGSHAHADTIRFGVGGGGGAAAPPPIPTYTIMNPHDRAESYVLYYGMLNCFNGKQSIPNGEVMAAAVAANADTSNSVSSWFLDKAIGDGQDGSVECGSAEQAAVKLWGYNSFDQMLTDWGYVNPGNNNDWTISGSPGGRIGAALRSRIFSNADPQLSLDAQYIYYRDTLVSACKISDPTPYATAAPSLRSAADGGAGHLKLTEPQQPDFLNTTVNIYTINDNLPPAAVPNVFPQNSPLNNNSLSCTQIADRASGGAGAYMRWAVNNKAAATAATAATGNGTGQPAGTTTCSSEIGGAGWIVCPVMNLLATIGDGILGFLSDAFLSPNIGLFDKSSGTYTAWSVFQSYANIAFVIVFLIIIYSQITSAGVSNYGIKRMLPRLIIAAILVNISFYICQAAIDISNILGYSINHLFKAIPAVQGAAKDAGLPAWKTAIGFVLAGVGLVAAIIGLLLAISVPVILAALLAAGMIVLILLVREAAIVLLVVISPLAFVAYLLPNTEQWFKKWYKMFSTLLLVFPLIALVFGASSLAGRIINGTAAKATGKDAAILQLTALGMATIPLFVVPSLLKGSVAATGALGAKLQGMGNKATGKVGARAKDSTYAGAYMNQRKRIKAATRAQSYGKGVQGYISRSRFSGRAGTELGATGSALASREEKEAVDNEIVRMQKQPNWTEANRLSMASEEFQDAMRKKDSTRARAAQSIMLSSGNAGITALQGSMAGLEGDANYSELMSHPSGQKVLSDLNGAGIKSKNAALAKLAYSQAGTKVTDIARDGKTYADLTDAELAGQNENNIQAAINDGGLSQRRAIEMQSNDTVWSQLSDTKKALINAQAENDTATQSAGGRIYNIDGNNGARDRAQAEEDRRNRVPPSTP